MFFLAVTLLLLEDTLTLTYETTQYFTLWIYREKTVPHSN
jgi:hypothetical protein